MNPLTLLPAKARKIVYFVYGTAVIVVGSLAAAGVDVRTAPDVLAYLGGALALQAALNVNRVRDGEDFTIVVPPKR